MRMSVMARGCRCASRRRGSFGHERSANFQNTQDQMRQVNVFVKSEYPR
jgi:hypothetical protein